MWLKRTDGLKSSSFTFVVIGFTIVSLWLLLSVFTKVFGLEIREFSGTEAMAYLSPLLAYAWGRKWQEDKVLAGGGSEVETVKVRSPKGSIEEKDLTDELEDEKLTENGD